MSGPWDDSTTPAPSPVAGVAALARERELGQLIEQVKQTLMTATATATKVEELVTRLAVHETKNSQVHAKFDELHALVVRGSEGDRSLKGQVSELEQWAENTEQTLAPLLDGTDSQRSLADRVVELELLLAASGDDLSLPEQVAENSRTTAELRVWKRRVLVALTGGGSIGFFGGGGAGKLAKALTMLAQALGG